MRAAGNNRQMKFLPLSSLSFKDASAIAVQSRVLRTLRSPTFLRDASVGLFVFALCAVAFAQGGGQSFPLKPVHLVVHNNAASAPDILARQIGAKLTDIWKQPVVVDNKGGGAGIVGTDYVVKSPADGYNLLVASDGPMTILPSFNNGLPYNVKKDLVPVVSLGEIDFVLVANPKTGFKTLKDFVSAAKANPGKYNFASAGNGSAQQIAMEVLKQNAGFYLTHIPYSGGPAGLNGVMAGDVDVMFIALAPAIAQIQAGRLVALGVSSESRTALLPNVPAIAETYKGYQAGTWFGIFAPAGTPNDAVEKIGVDVNRVLADNALRSFLVAQGIKPTGYSGARFQQVLDRESAKYLALSKEVQIRTD